MVSLRVQEFCLWITIPNSCPLSYCQPRSSPPLVSEEKPLFTLVLAATLFISFPRLVVLNHTLFPRFRERKDGFSVGSNYVFCLKPLTRTFTCSRVTREVVEKHLKILIGIWFTPMFKNSDELHMGMRKALKHWIENTVGRSFLEAFTKISGQDENSRDADFLLGFYH